MKKILSICLFLLPTLTMLAANTVKETVSSPDGKLSMTITQSQTGQLLYSISRKKAETIITNSRLGVSIDNHLFESALGIPNEERNNWDENWCNNLKFMETVRTSVDTSYSMPYGEWAIIRNHYNEMIVRFLKGKKDDPNNTSAYNKEKCYYFNIKVRAYNEGIAFCYEFPETSNGLFINIQDELTEFRFPQGCKALCTSWAQGQYEWRSLSQPWNEQAERPLTIRLDNGTAVSLLEARCVNYARTKFVLKGDNIVKAQPYDGCEIMTPFSTSWRLVMVADKMTDLLNHDYMVLNLNDPQALCKPEGSTFMTDGWKWIRPGKVFRTGLRQQEGMAAIDFAARQGLQYVHFDAGWYGPEMKMSSSALSVSPEKDLDFRKLTAYAKTKGISVFVYINQRALYKELDQILDTLVAWGIKGVKFGFVQVGNQKWTTWLHDAVRKCAEHRLLVDIHDEYRPTGFSRTYPNLMTAEGIGGNEEMPTATHNVTLPFTRFLCGPADYTLCYFNNRVKATYAHQLAMAAVYYSPLTWMFWYDKYNEAHGEKELEFWKQIPTTFDDSKTLQGEPGEYIVTVRRSGNNWFLGAMNNGTALPDANGKYNRNNVLNGKVTRTITVPLDFLDKGKKYIAHIYEDDPTIISDSGDDNNFTTKRTKVRGTTKEVTSLTILSLPLLDNGGAAVWFEASALSHKNTVNADKQLKYCHRQVQKALKELQGKPYNMEVRNASDMSGNSLSLRQAVPEEWCSGFWPGILWMNYASSKDNKVKVAAEAYTQPIIDDILSKPIYDHDLGFIVINSLIKGLEAGNMSMKPYILKAAEMLGTQFNDKVGTTLSWPRHIQDFGGHNTIMDNMLNIELLLWASQNGGKKYLADYAVKHAETTMQTLFNPDGTGYHVAVYDTLTGKHLYNQTHQGFADNSMWSRGQAWAIYGYTMMYRYTKQQKFLDFAQKVTDIYLKRLYQTSDDWIPLWDMDAVPCKGDASISKNGSFRGVPKDASAAAIVASALLDLSTYINTDKSKEYKSAAVSMLSDLSTSRYLSGKINNMFLLHSTGNHPAGTEIDYSIIYADYYYIEALQKLKK